MKEKKKTPQSNPHQAKLSKEERSFIGKSPKCILQQALNAIYGAEIMRRESITFGQRGPTPFLHALSESFKYQ
jgi:hypothetical protein